MEIRIGTSGYSFEDWRGVFYPGQIIKGKMLDFYQAYFNTVEINSTYYKIPHPRIMYNISQKVNDKFEFVVKAHKSLTHERMNLEKVTEQFHESIKPLRDHTNLRGILAQFPWSFKYSRANLQYFALCHDLMRDNHLFVEFRHNSWSRPETYETLASLGISYVSVDEPRLPGLLPSDLKTTGDTAYIRLHGRNGDKWWNGGPLRYDYSYDERELLEWKEKILKLKETHKKAFIFFNNCHLGQAVKNARQLMKMLDL